MDRYYNIQIDRKVSNFNDGAIILQGEIKKLHTWERGLFVEELLKKGYKTRQIAEMLHISVQAVKKCLPRRHKLPRKVKNADIQ